MGLALATIDIRQGCAPDQGMASLARNRNFRLIFSATAISNLGDGVFLIALPLVAADLSRDPTTIAGVALVLRLPWLLFSLLAAFLVGDVFLTYRDYREWAGERLCGDCRASYSESPPLLAVN